MDDAIHGSLLRKGLGAQQRAQLADILDALQIPNRITESPGARFPDPIS